MSDNATDPERIDTLQLAFREKIQKQGLKSSRQRDVIAEVFFSIGGHLSVEELLDRVREVDKKVSQATVYRTMNLLRELGFAEARNFFDGRTLYEISDAKSDHHDHVICLDCDRIVEFVDEAIEARQETLVNDLGFRLATHRMDLFCRPKRDASGKCLHCHELAPQED